LTIAPTPTSLSRRANRADNDARRDDGTIDDGPAKRPRKPEVIK
jgi:hypothetical protein